MSRSYSLGGILAGIILSLAAPFAHSAEPAVEALVRAGLHPLEMNKPAPHFFEGAVLGNGGMGVIVCTRPDAIMLHVGHNDAWDIRIAEKNKDKLVPFEHIWERLKRWTPEDKVWYNEYRKMSRENYAQPYPRPWPCGTVLLGFDRRLAELLGHRVNVDTGLCEVFFLVDNQRVALEVFVDMQADRIWMRMKNVAGQPIAAPFNRLRLLPQKGMDATNHASADTMTFRQVLPVLGDAREKDEALRLSVRIDGQVTPEYTQHGPFVACVQLEHGRATEIPNKIAELPQPTLDTYQSASDASRASWTAYWDRAGVQLDDHMLERTWYHNMYFLNCSVRPGVTCPGLFANCSHNEYGTAWHGDYHFNYNVQQPFWVTFSSNQLEKHLPYVDLIDFLLPLSQSWAKEFLGLPGAFFPHSAYPVEMTMNPYPVMPWAMEICEVPWAVQSLWWHYLYSMDKDFLRERAFVPMREAVVFLNAYMRRPEARGPQWNDDKFHIYPTVAPELHGLRADPLLNSDCIVDLTLTKFVFQAYLEACRLLDRQEQEADLMRDVREILDNYPNYPKAESQRGTVFVSVPGESPEQVYNAPASLASVFPGEEIGLHSPPEELQIAINTWNNQQNEGGNDLVFLNLQGARIGQLDLERFKRQINYCLLPNGTCTDRILQSGGRYTDQTDFDYMARMGIWFENFALPVVINECLMQSYNGQLRLFPNWPMDKAATFHQLRAVGAFLVSARCVQGMVEWVRVQAEVGGTLRLINPWTTSVEITHNGEVSTMKGELLELQTKPGDIVLFRSSHQG
ncbi:MAG: hypothetical protein GXY44_15005 [Phycisphaerales bacterium]|nr:hypothetical protein [Phycisphaerales bacterium]